MNFKGSGMTSAKSNDQATHRDKKANIQTRKKERKGGKTHHIDVTVRQMVIYKHDLTIGLFGGNKK